MCIHAYINEMNKDKGVEAYHSRIFTLFTSGCEGQGGCGKIIFHKYIFTLFHFYHSILLYL